MMLLLLMLMAGLTGYVQRAHLTAMQWQLIAGNRLIQAARERPLAGSQMLANIWAEAGESHSRRWHFSNECSCCMEILDYT